MKSIKAILPALVALALLALAPQSAAAAGQPAWAIELHPQPTNFAPGRSPQYALLATNVGAKSTEGLVTVEINLPKPWVIEPGSRATVEGEGVVLSCTAATPTISCQTSEPVDPGRQVFLKAIVAIPPAETAPATLTASAAIRGGGAGEAQTTIPTAVQAGPVSFGILPGFASPITEADGSPATLAGSHPYQQTISFGFPSENPGDAMTGAGHPRDFTVELPRGLVGSPAATPVLCTEAQLQSHSCPEASQLGALTVTSILGGPSDAGPLVSPIYNMVPVPGVPAVLGTDVGGFGFFAHIYANVRSEGDYGIEAKTADVIAFGQEPLFTLTTQLWGVPSVEAHDYLRGNCLVGGHVGATCPLSARYQAPLLTMPADCPGQQLDFGMTADSWESPSPPGALQEAAYESGDLAGSPVQVSGCGQLAFEPTISARPTTNLADSPTGLDVDIRQPQNEDPEARATSPLRDATVTLPPGMVANPSQASGLDACTEAQIGYLNEDPEAGIHFSKLPQSCPDGAKLGTAEVKTPLVVERNASTELQIDPETGEPLPRTLSGGVYLAKPYDNPFGSLLALYLVIEDPQTGIVSKLAGRVTPDPQTGQLTTTFKENPELPLSDIQLHLFKGARSSLISPPTCGTHTTLTDLTPWSSPEGADATPSDSFQTTAAPGGGPCPTSAGQVPNAPSFTAGTLAPQAGAYSPFVLKLSRDDGTQRLTGFDSTLPPGLTGKLAGIGTCPDAAIARATARSNPNEGILERNSPSCPASSALGTVTIGAGAGPNPFYTNGTAYLAGPYKGAPLSMAVITPAIAGPFDLGVVVVRAALYVDPASARIHAVSDPFPTILQGIPLDLRSVAVKLDRPSFTLNPTSCDPMAIAANAIAPLGAPAALSTPFQVGGCSALAFKPKLAIKLSGGTRRSKNPALKATLTMPPGNTNVAKASVALPHSEFLDQGHIRTICTRVQFAIGNGAGCPAGSVYGKARAITPLLDAPLEGPVFLRANGGERELPDLVAALHGQIEVELIGFIDSAKGGIRTTFQTVPDAPVSKFVLEMQGGKKGLLENSTNLCKTTNRATALFDGQNGKVKDFNPVVKNDCKGKRPGKGNAGK
jgi:hypothetical protein